MRQQTGFREDEARGFRQIRQRRPMPEAIELGARRPVAQLRLVAEREQRLLATRVAPGARNLAHRVMRQVCRLAGARRVRKRAVVADVTAELGQRDEDLAGIGQQRTMPLVAAPRRGRQQQIEIVHIRQRERLLARELALGRQIVQKLAHLAIIHDSRHDRKADGDIKPADRAVFRHHRYAPCPSTPHQSQMLSAITLMDVM